MVSLARKALNFGDPNDPELKPEVKAFFTLKRSWAWSSGKWFGDGQDKWPWLERYPQKYGWSKSSDIPEQYQCPQPTILVAPVASYRKKLSK